MKRDKNIKREILALLKLPNWKSYRKYQSLDKHPHEDYFRSPININLLLICRRIPSKTTKLSTSLADMIYFIKVSIYFIKKK